MRQQDVLLDHAGYHKNYTMQCTTMATAIYGFDKNFRDRPKRPFWNLTLLVDQNAEISARLSASL